MIYITFFVKNPLFAPGCIYTANNYEYTALVTGSLLWYSMKKIFYAKELSL